MQVREQKWERERKREVMKMCELFSSSFFSFFFIGSIL